PLLATNDIAHCLMRKRAKPDEVAYGFPIDTSTVLVIERQVVRRLLDWAGSRWIAVVEHADLSDDDLIDCVKCAKTNRGKTVENVQRNGRSVSPVLHCRQC